MKILSICGSPRKGNSEAILNHLKKFFENSGAENEIILLREKNIEHCDGCTEYCNKNLACHKKDSMPEILEKIKSSGAYIFACPNYFKMPPGIFKDFIDRCSVFYTAKTNFSGKKCAVICTGADTPDQINACLKNISENFCKTLGIPVVAKKSFQSNSDLHGKYNDIFENNLNPTIKKDLEKIAKTLLN